MLVMNGSICIVPFLLFEVRGFCSMSSSLQRHYLVSSVEVRLVVEFVLGRLCTCL